MNLFKLVGSIMVDNTAANKSISATDSKAGGLAKTLLKGVGTAAKFGAALGGAALVGAGALVKTATSAAETADNIDKMSQKLGLSRKSFQELDFVLSQSGLDIDSFGSGMKSLLKNMDSVSEGGKAATENFKKLGISVKNADGSLRDQEEVLFETIAAFQQMEDSSEKSRLAQELFGKQGQELIPLLNGEAGSLEEMRQQAQDLGLVLSDDVIDSGVKLTDTMDQVKRSLSAIVTNIGGAVMPILQQFLDFIIAHMPQIQEVMNVVFTAISTVVSTAWDIVSAVIDWMKEKLESSGVSFTDVMSTIQNVVSVAFNVIKEVWDVILKPVFDALMKVLGVVGQYFASKMPEIKATVQVAFKDIVDLWNNNLKPMFKALGDYLNDVLIPVFKFVFSNVIVPLVETAFKGIKEAWNKVLKPALKGISDFITGIFTGNWKKAFSGLADIVKSAFNAMVGFVKAPLNAMITLINAFINSINKIKLPDKIASAVGMKSPNIPNIPYLAKGGNVIQGGGAIIGENGPEFLNLPSGAKVTPLTKNGSSLLNTENVEALLGDVVSLLSALNNNIGDNMAQAVQGMSIKVDNREFGRVVRQFA